MARDHDDEFDEAESNVYTDDAREDLVEGDAISAEEEAFMRGYEQTDEEIDKDLTELDEDEDI